MSDYILNKNPCNIHFVGIGGIGMSGIAEIMHNLGYRVTGSDLSNNAITKRLAKLGIQISTGHNKENVLGADYIVISSAIPLKNVEVQAAIDNAIPVIKRSEMLSELMRMKKYAIAISGSHGKTTTTALMAEMFESAGFNPSVINGGIINHKSTNAYIGDSEFIIVEADESDATFTKVPATISVITNIDEEHMDFYGSFDNLLNHFKTFITNIPFYGFAVACIDNENTRKLVNSIIERKVITYGIESDDAHVRACNIRSDKFLSTFDVEINLPNKEKFEIKDIILQAAGLHNVLNSLSTIAVAAEMEVPNNVIKNALEKFQGVKRRFSKITKYKGALLIDDYAHHPEEIKKTIDTARNVLKNTDGKLVAIFQPHRYTRLKNLFDDFVDSLSNVDKLILLGVYNAGEEKIEGFESSDLAREIKAKNPDLNTQLCSDMEDLEREAESLKKNDLMLFMGAGNITNIAYELGDILNNKSKIVA